MLRNRRRMFRGVWRRDADVIAARLIQKQASFLPQLAGLEKWRQGWSSCASTAVLERCGSSPSRRRRSGSSASCVEGNRRFSANLLRCWSRMRTPQANAFRRCLFDPVRNRSLATNQPPGIRIESRCDRIGSVNSRQVPSSQDPGFCSS